MNMITFKSMATITSIVCFVLAIIWGFFPNYILEAWGTTFAYSAGLAGRRMAALFLGIGFLILFSRNDGSSNSRQSIVKGIVVGCSTLALLGVYEFISGGANFWIFIAVIIEVILSLGFLAVLRKE